MYFVIPILTYEEKMAHVWEENVLNSDKIK